MLSLRTRQTQCTDNQWPGPDTQASLQRQRPPAILHLSASASHLPLNKGSGRPHATDAGGCLATMLNVKRPCPHTHQSQGIGENEQKLDRRPRGLCAREREKIKSGGFPRAWKEVEADEAFFDKALSPHKNIIRKTVRQ